jgi:quercetin dioxygenase-like cupin family protein
MSVCKLLYAIPAVLLLAANVVAQKSDARMPRPLVVDSAKIQPTITFTTQTMKFIASSADTGGVTTVFESNEMPGYKTTWHRHDNAEESFYVLEGVLTVKFAHETHTLGPGSFVLIPRGTPHAQGNLTDNPARFITTVTPGGIEEFFRDRSELLKTIKPGDPNYDARYRVVLEKHKDRIAIIGPWDLKNP